MTERKKKINDFNILAEYRRIQCHSFCSRKVAQRAENTRFAEHTLHLQKTGQKPLKRGMPLYTSITPVLTA